jgi:hypothetical protein
MVISASNGGGDLVRLVAFFATGMCVLMLTQVVAFCGVPCAGTSTVNAYGTGACAPGVAVCPAGDYDVLTVDILVRDCYGTPLSGMAVAIYPGFEPDDFYFCPGYDMKTAVTGPSGETSVDFRRFGGCGELWIYAICEGITLGPSALIPVASYDCYFPADGVVNLSDFIVFAGVYNNSDPCCDYNCDGIVNLTDFIFFAGHYNHTCP